jgi:hypothetical protein
VGSSADDGHGHRRERELKPVKETIKTVISRGAGSDKHVPKPEAALIHENAGQVYSVSPDLAAKWLEHNTRNRKLRQSVVNKYAADMREGRWLLTGDAIAFDKNGAVVNGQHRLWAVLESGITVPMLVTFNLDPEVVAVLDDHLKRSLTDVAGIRRPGSSINTLHSAIANTLVRSSIMAMTVDRSQALERVTRQKQLDALDRHWDAIEFAVRDCFSSHKQRGLTIANVLTPVARAYYTKERERLKEFGEVMRTGINNKEGDQPAILLRNWLLRTAATKGMRALGETIYNKTERALHAFLNDERLSTLFEASNEMFPLPEEERKGKR